MRLVTRWRTVPGVKERGQVVVVRPSDGECLVVGNHMVDEKHRQQVLHSVTSFLDTVVAEARGRAMPRGRTHTRTYAILDIDRGAWMEVYERLSDAGALRDYQEGQLLVLGNVALRVDPVHVVDGKNEVFAVLINDRHSDPGITLWGHRGEAIEYARKRAREFCRHDEDYEEDTSGKHWEFMARYSCEGDYARVTRHTLGSERYVLIGENDD